MFNELKEAWITEMYKSYKGILLPSVDNQLSKNGLYLDLDSLPLEPIPFKELFIRWLISINKDRLARGQEIFVTRGIVLTCPLWRAIKCPLRSIKLTKEGMFNRPKVSTTSIGSIGSTGSVGSIGSKRSSGSIN